MLIQFYTLVAGNQRDYYSQFRRTQPGGTGRANDVSIIGPDTRLAKNGCL